MVLKIEQVGKGGRVFLFVLVGEERSTKSYELQSFALIDLFYSTECFFPKVLELKELLIVTNS